MYCVYVLISQNYYKTYTGVTCNLKRRLSEHNIGQEKSTKPYLPYAVLHCEVVYSLKEAYRREKFYKSTSGRRKIKDFIGSLSN